MSIKFTRELILQIRDDAELTAMARVIEGAQREAWWQGFGSDWDKARVSAYMLRAAGFGLVGESEADSNVVTKDGSSPAERIFASADPVKEAAPDDERHTAWCRGGHDGQCRRGRLSGTEK